MAAHGVSLKSLAKAERPRAWRATILRLLGYLKPHTRELGVAVVWMAVAAAANAALPAITGTIIDTAVRSPGEPSALTPPAMLLLGAVLVGWLGQRQQIMLLGEVGQRALQVVRTHVFDKVLELSVAFFDNIESGDLMSRLVNDIETVNSFLSQGFRRVIGATFGLVATLGGMLLVDWRLALATLGIVPLLLLATRLFGVIARAAFRRRQSALGGVSATLAEELAGVRVAQAFNRTTLNRDQFEARNAASRDASVTAAAVSSAFSPTLAFLGSMSMVSVAAYGGWLASRGLATIGVVVAFISYARAFFNSLSQLSSLYAETQAALAGGERVFDLLDTPALVVDSPDAIALGRVTGEIEFRGVSFSYAQGPEVLHDVDLRIAAGTTLAIVGPTGAGKTTLVNLVARFYDPSQGSVLVDGNDVRQVLSASLRGNLGMVLQEPFLFAGTIEENIRFGRPTATEEDVRAAARAARVLGFIEGLAEGFDTTVGERGGTLSTGQRQLIAFARALLADPAILILDEATSSVDTRTELLIQEALAELLVGRTALVIAHRLSTVRASDRIVVLDDGNIVEDGTYAELVAAGGTFARLHADQFGQ